MSAIPPYGAEERWRRTVDNRHRPLKLKVGRLLREFGYARLDPDVTAAIEARLERVGLCVQPPLHTVAGDQIITLELLRPAVPGVSYEPPITNDFAAVPPPVPDVYQPFVDPPEQGRLIDVDALAAEDEQARLVRVAVEAERRAREAYDQAAGAAAERIAALERELAAEREAKARTSDQSTEIRQRIDLEREDATARLADLAANERAASEQVDAERARIGEGDEHRRRPFAEVDGPIERALSDADDGPPWNAAAAPLTLPEPKRKSKPKGKAKSKGKSKAIRVPVLVPEPEPPPTPEPAREPEPEVPEQAAAQREPASWDPTPVVVPSDPIAPERLPNERRARLGMVLVALIALAAIAAAGYAIGKGDDPSAPAGPALAREASRSGVQLRYPAGWVRVASAPRIPGLRFTRPIALSASDSAIPGLVAGVVKDAVGSDLLPAAVRKRLPAAPTPQPVLLGDTQALSYPRLKLEGLQDAVTIYAVPTADGSAVVACVGPVEASEFFDACGRAASTLQIDGLPSLRIDGARALPVGPAPSYGHRIANAVGAIDGTLRNAGEDLAKARTAKGQAKLATAIARSYGRAARTLDAGAVSARDREGHDALVAAIRSAAGEYERLASAARDDDRGRYGDAAAAVRSAEGRLREAVAALGKLGYEA